ncbi:MAG: transporter ATP-binding protein [Herbinix sp.]|nr:transporter ATP-binding protein [Herbinix sp.]
MLRRNPNLWFLKRILSYLRPFKNKIWIITVCLVLSSVLGFFQPLILRRITDHGLLQKNLQVIIISVITLLGLILFNQFLEVVQTKIFTDIHNKFKFTMWNQAFNKLLHLKTDYYTDKNNSQIINCLQTDVDHVSSIMDRFMILNISFLFRVISGVAGLLFISWKLTFIVLVMVPIKYLVVQAISKHKKKKMERLIENYCDFSSWLGDNIEGVKDIKLWNLYNQRYIFFEKKLKSIINSEKENTMLDTYNMCSEIILGWMVTGILYILGGILVVNGSLTIGGVLSFITYSNYVTGPISSIINLKYFLSRIYPSGERLFKFLDLEDEYNPENAIEINKESLEIQFKNVAFTYTEKGEVLKDINFSVSKGEKVAIIGSNGSGKTTLVNLLLRFIEPTSGEIEICNENINRSSLEQYRSLFAVVSQEPYLFYDTIQNNINLDESGREDMVEKACLQSGASEFINKLPEKENSIVGQNGAKLSGGEKQKLAVARAIVKDSPIVILDEATSGYDVESDSYLHDIILNELIGKTVIMITHRYENLVGMDRVYRLSEGRLEMLESK